MADDFEPDPEAVGPAIMAWYALHDALEADPAEMVAWAADVIADRLGTFGPGVANPLTLGQASVAIDDARLLLGMIAEIFGRNEPPAGDDRALAFKAELKRRSAGRPTQNQILPQSLAWWRHAREVEALIEAGDMQKVAVGKVANRIGEKDRVVAGWLRGRRKALKQARRRFRDSDKSAN